jgi:2-iminobutanoate/2-iminopropanoate deaminase
MKHFQVFLLVLLFGSLNLSPKFSYSQLDNRNKYKQPKRMEKKIITSTNAPEPIGPYSHGVLLNGVLYTSGQVAKDAKTGEMVQSDIKSETRKVMENLEAILKEADMDFSNVLKTTIYCTDLGNFAAINEVYGSFFKANFPARETVQVVKLPLNANVEISVVAAQ